MDKYQFKRYQILDDCFSNKTKKFYFEDLVIAVNQGMQDYLGTSISIRSIRGDIQFMKEEYEIELDPNLRDGKKMIYRYKNPENTIYKLGVNKKEIGKLRETFIVFQRIQGLDNMGWIADTLPKLQNLLGEQQPVVGFNKSDIIYEVKDLFLTLYHSIVEKKVLKVFYQDFKAKEPYPITFHPYYIKEYNRRWFIFGLNPEKNSETWNLAFDRIKGLEFLPKVEFQPTNIDWNKDYFSDLVGVTRPINTKVQKIKIQVDDFTYQYIHSKPLHESQKRIKSENGFTVFQLEVYINKELKRELLSYGSSLKVLEPESLANELKNEI